jgi:lipid-A-disaccharide synthase
MAHASLALAASGTVTVEAALLGTPMVSYYRVTAISWLLGKLLVRVPFYSMVNLIAGRAVVPELMQGQMTGERLASEARRLLGDDAARGEMLAGLAEVRRKLEAPAAARLDSQTAAAPDPRAAATPDPRIAATPAARAAAIVREILQGEAAHVS